MRLFKFCGIFLLASLLVFAVHAEDSAIFVSTASLIDADETVLYSVILASGEEAVEDILIEVSLPEGFSFIEQVIAPPDLQAAVSETGLVWELAELPADTILGPFTYRVAVDEEITEIPQSLPVTVSWPDGLMSVESEDLLEPLAVEGTIVVNAAGTLNEAGEADAIEVGDTGVLLFLPENAVSEATTIRLERLPVPLEAGNELSLLDEETWWCSVIVIHLEPNVEISASAILAVPSRRVITPGLPATGFGRSTDGEWAVLENLDIFVAPSGAHTIVDGFVLEDGKQLALGVNNNIRINSEVNSTNITDGTSNTVRGYVEQDNLIRSRINNP